MSSDELGRNVSLGATRPHCAAESPSQGRFAVREPICFCKSDMSLQVLGMVDGLDTYIHLVGNASGR